MCEKTYALKRSIWLVVFAACCALAPLQKAMAQDGTKTVDLSSSAGIAWQFQPEGGDAKPIIVPGGGWRAQGYTCDAGTYKAAIPIPKSAQGHGVQIVFDAVNFGATVSAAVGNAPPVQVAQHINGWVPFAADVTAIVHPGEPLQLTVEAQGRKKFLVNGKYTVPDGASWDPYLEEGILRGVHLKILPLVHVDDVFVITQVTQKALRAQLTLTNSSKVPQAVTAKPVLSSQNAASFAYPKVPATTLTLAPGETRTVTLGPVAWNLGPRSYWWPNVPYRPGYRAQRHVLDVALVVKGQVVQHYRQRFGFRQFQAIGSHYYLNGVHCNLRGDNQQEADFGTDAYGIRPGFGPPTPGNGGWPKAVDNLERLNFNVMRIHQIPATPYMLDVCDALGFMLVEESPLRGSERLQDFQAGHDNMLNMDRELVLRDRNHPATVIWSAANEWRDPIKEAVPAIQALDATRPVIADGVGDLPAPFINMQHYVHGGGAPHIGGTPRADRPYGETEDVWSHDDTRQGFAWMATGVRIRRLLGDADLRNYTLNNAWSNYVPGENPDNEILEAKVKGFGNPSIQPPLAAPWQDHVVRLMQKCYNPVAVCDVQFDQFNKDSDNNGDWPVVKPLLIAGTHVVRQLAVFNDEFSGQRVRVDWVVHGGAPTGPKVAAGSETLTIPLGEFRTLDMAFTAPLSPQELYVTLSSHKDGRLCFADDLISYHVAPVGTTLLPDGDYRIHNYPSNRYTAPGPAGGPALVQQQGDGSADQLWHLTNLGNDDVTLTLTATSQRLDVDGTADGANAVLRPAAADTQTWHLEQVGDHNYTLTDKATGKRLDVAGGSTKTGEKLVQADPNGGDDQVWTIQQ